MSVLQTSKYHPARHAAFPSLVAVGFALVGCAVEGNVPSTDGVGQTQKPIIGGMINPGDPAVVHLSAGGGFCTGTLVAPTVVLTAAHCIPDAISGTVSFGQGFGDFTDTRRVIEFFPHRLYDAGLYQGYDIALIRLAEPAPDGIEPLPMNTTPLSDQFLGAQVRTTGFGMTDGVNQTGGGTKRQVTMTLDGVNDEHIVVGDRFRNTCQGDSGGPNFMVIDNVEQVVAVNSFGSEQCLGTSHHTRVDKYIDDFITEVVDAWWGPCARDFNCVTEGCNTPDPDCSVCGFDGVCATGCEKIDLDCPARGDLGELCSDREGCESLLCVAASDDERVKFCSTECDPNSDAPAFGCPNPLSTCGPGPDGKNVCLFAGITPSAQGAPCESGNDCRSGVCDPDDSICIEQCGDGQAECPSDFPCRGLGGGVTACRLPESGGGCTSSASLHGGWAAGAIALLLLVVATRKRRIGASQRR